MPRRKDNTPRAPQRGTLTVIDTNGKTRPTRMAQTSRTMRMRPLPLRRTRQLWKGKEPSTSRDDACRKKRGKASSEGLAFFQQQKGLTVCFKSLEMSEGGMSPWLLRMKLLTVCAAPGGCEPPRSTSPSPERRGESASPSSASRISALRKNGRVYGKLDACLGSKSRRARRPDLSCLQCRSLLPLLGLAFLTRHSGRPSSVCETPHSPAYRRKNLPTTTRAQLHCIFARCGGDTNGERDIEHRKKKEPRYRGVYGYSASPHRSRIQRKESRRRT